MILNLITYPVQVFPEPRRFRPERFLDDKGQLKQIDEFIPFSLGRRQCPGEGLARMELFLFTANIFNQFRVSVLSDASPFQFERPKVLVLASSGRHTQPANICQDDVDARQTDAVHGSSSASLLNYAQMLCNKFCLFIHVVFNEPNR